MNIGLCSERDVFGDEGFGERVGISGLGGWLWTCSWSKERTPNHSLHVVFKGPVLWTEKKTRTELDRTD
jgi:hypothetical protein